MTKFRIVGPNGESSTKALTLSEWHEAAWKLLPVESRYRAVEIIQSVLSSEDLEACRKAYDEHGDEWPSFEPFSEKVDCGNGETFLYPWHHSGGMAVRNVLRSQGFVDAELPPFDQFYGEGTDVRNWDDYYVACFEAAAGVRSVED
jgi:hypothetical protein